MPAKSEIISPGSYRTQILSRRWLSEDTFEMELRRPAGFVFLAGQHITIQFEGNERDYSLVSAPHESSLLICVRRVQAGVISTALAALEKDADIFFTGPYGYFTFRDSFLKPVFVATGTGISPLVSMIRAGAKAYMALHGAASEADLYYREEMAKSARIYIPCLSGNGKGPPGAFFGRVTAYLANELPQDIYEFYLCGGQEMIRDVVSLVDERFSRSRVYWENFY